MLSVSVTVSPAIVIHHRGEMATSVAFKSGITVVTPSSSSTNRFAPILSVSAVPRWFHTHSSRSFSFDYLNRIVDADRRPDSTVSRRRTDLRPDSTVTRRRADLRPDSTVTRRRDIIDDDDVFSDLFDRFMSASNRGRFGPRKACESNENEERLKLRFDMPGLDKENVKISIEVNTLIIKAKVEKESKDDNDEPPRSFSRRIDLKMDVYKLEEIKAEMNNGVLKIRVPKVKMEERKDVRQIQVD